MTVSPTASHAFVQVVQVLDVVAVHLVRLSVDCRAMPCAGCQRNAERPRSRGAGAKTRPCGAGMRFVWPARLRTIVIWLEHRKLGGLTVAGGALGQAHVVGVRDAEVGVKASRGRQVHRALAEVPAMRSGLDSRSSPQL